MHYTATVKRSLGNTTVVSLSWGHISSLAPFAASGPWMADHARGPAGTVCGCLRPCQHRARKGSRFRGSPSGPQTDRRTSTAPQLLCSGGYTLTGTVLSLNSLMQIMPVLNHVWCLHETSSMQCIGSLDSPRHFFSQKDPSQSLSSQYSVSAARTGVTPFLQWTTFSYTKKWVYHGPM